MVRVVSDSGAHLAAETRDRYKIGTVPLQVLFGTRGYRDEIDLSNEQFFYMLTHEKVQSIIGADVKIKPSAHKPEPERRHGF